MDNPNQSPRNEYVPISEERRLFLEEKYKRRNLAPESLIIRPGFRKLHLATIVMAVGKQRNSINLSMDLACSLTNNMLLNFSYILVRDGRIFYSLCRLWREGDVLHPSKDRSHSLPCVRLFVELLYSNYVNFALIQN